MIDKSIVKKILGGVMRNRKQSFFDRQIMHARREWLLGVLAGLAIVVYAGITSYNTYMTYRTISPSQTSDLPTDTLYRAPMMKTVLEDFEFRRQIHENLKSKLINSRREEVAVSISNFATSTPAEAPQNESRESEANPGLEN